MHCMMSILGGTRLSDKDRHSIHVFLKHNGYAGDDFGYYSTVESRFVTLYVIAEPEKEDYWIHGKPEVIWFSPMNEIIVRSERNTESHNECYHIAKEIAAIITDCIIYDHQIGVVYDPDGNPYAHSVTDGHAKEFGAGINALSRHADKNEGHDERTPEDM